MVLITLPYAVLCAVQAQNIAITVRTIIVGLLYLATFIFSANALGLTGELPFPCSTEKHATDMTHV